MNDLEYLLNDIPDIRWVLDNDREAEFSTLLGIYGTRLKTWRSLERNYKALCEVDGPLYCTFSSAELRDAFRRERRGIKPEAAAAPTPVQAVAPAVAPQRAKTEPALLPRMPRPPHVHPKDC